MDTSDPDIEFNEDGTCCYCDLYDRRVATEVFTGQEGKEILNGIIEKIKAKGIGKPYDCMIGVSGGVDSTYAIWKLKEMGLRPLALHVDNGWNSELAVDNIKKVLEKLDIDLVTVVLDWEAFRDLQLSFLRASVADAEVPTDHIYDNVNFRVAMEHGFKYLINGGNIATEAFVPKAWGYDSRDYRHLKALHKQFGTRSIKSLPLKSLTQYGFSIFFKGVRWITILNYMDYNKPLAIQELEAEFGWRPYGGKHFESIYTRFYQGYILKHKFGFDKRRAHLANLVLSENITREQALAEIAEEDYIGTKIYEEDRELVIKKLDLTEKKFKEIMALPVKSHLDYPNSSFVLRGMPGVLSLVKRFAKRV